MIQSSDIVFAAENSKSSYYRINNEITVIMGRNSNNEPTWCCLTCRECECTHVIATKAKFGRE